MEGVGETVEDGTADQGRRSNSKPDFVVLFREDAPGRIERKDAVKSCVGGIPSLSRPDGIRRDELCNSTTDLLIGGFWLTKSGRTRIKSDLVGGGTMS